MVSSSSLYWVLKSSRLHSMHLSIVLVPIAWSWIFRRAQTMEILLQSNRRMIYQKFHQRKNQKYWNETHTSIIQKFTVPSWWWWSISLIVQWNESNSHRTFLSMHNTLENYISSKSLTISIVSCANPSPSRGWSLAACFQNCIMLQTKKKISSTFLKLSLHYSKSYCIVLNVFKNSHLFTCTYFSMILYSFQSHLVSINKYQVFASHSSWIVSSTISKDNLFEIIKHGFVVEHYLEF